MTRILTKTEGADSIEYTDGSVTLTIQKTVDGSLKYSATIDVSAGDPLHRGWSELVSEIEQENTIQ